MQGIMDLSNQFDTPFRRWGKGGDQDIRYCGELATVLLGTVFLTTASERKRGLRDYKLAGQDIKYLLDNLTDGDKEKLWRINRPEDIGLENLCERYATQKRHQCRRREDQKRSFGELSEVEKGKVVLKTSKGGRYDLDAKLLLPEDVQCLRHWLMLEEMQVLWADLNDE
jgi:hypothetical protein